MGPQEATLPKRDLVMTAVEDVGFFILSPMHVIYSGRGGKRNRLFVATSLESIFVFLCETRHNHMGDAARKCGRDVYIERENVCREESTFSK